MHTFENVNIVLTRTQNLNMGVNDKVRTDLDLHKGSNLGMGLYAVERSCP